MLVQRSSKISEVKVKAGRRLRKANWGPDGRAHPVLCVTLALPLSCIVGSTTVLILIFVSLLTVVKEPKNPPALTERLVNVAILHGLHLRHAEQGSNLHYRCTQLQLCTPVVNTFDPLVNSRSSYRAVVCVF